MIDGEPVWDSLAIAETVAEMHPEKQLWPEDAGGARAWRARSAPRCTPASRHCVARWPMNIRSTHPGKGMTPESRKDIDRIVALWTDCRERFGGAGSLLFGRFTVADAFYAPVVTRFRTYAVKLPRVARGVLRGGAGAVRGARVVRCGAAGDRVRRRQTSPTPTK